MLLGGGRRVAALLCWCLVSARWSTAAAQEQASAELQPVLEQADERFVQQDFAGALALLEPACAGSQEAACAFALAAVHHALGHCEAAVHHYRQYRQLAPSGEHLEEVLPALEQLEARCGDSLAATGPEVDVAPTAVTPRLAAPRLIASPFTRPLLDPKRDTRAASEQVSEQGHAPLMVSLLGLAGGSAATALTMGILALDSANTCRDLTVYDERYKTECQEREPRYRSLALGFGLGTAALLAGGITVWWLDARSQASVGLALEGTPELRYQRRF